MINQNNSNEKNTPGKQIYFNGSKIYFTKEIERKCFFFLTVAMLLLGILSGAGLF